MKRYRIDFWDGLIRMITGLDTRLPMPFETVALGLTQPLSVAIEVGDSDRRLTIEVAHVDDSGRDGEPALALAFSDGCARNRHNSAR